MRIKTLLFMSLGLAVGLAFVIIPTSEIIPDNIRWFLLGVQVYAAMVGGGLASKRREEI